MKQNKEIEARVSESTVQQVSKAEDEFTEVYVCHVCEYQFLLKSREGIHVCEDCKKGPVKDLRAKFYKLDVETEYLKKLIADFEKKLRVTILRKGTIGKLVYTRMDEA